MEKRVITGNHVLFGIGLLGTAVVIAVMVLDWVRHGTPFLGGAGLFANPIADTLWQLVITVAIATWGGMELAKAKRQANLPKSPPLAEKADAKFVVTGDHVLLIGGIVGTVALIVAMVLNWVRHETPFVAGIGLFDNPMWDTLLLVILIIPGTIVAGVELWRKPKPPQN